MLLYISFFTVAPSVSLSVSLCAEFHLGDFAALLWSTQNEDFKSNLNSFYLVFSYVTLEYVISLTHFVSKKLYPTINLGSGIFLIQTS